MVRSRLRRRLAAADGFTFVEVLVVVLIIGVLTSIALAAFLNQRSKAQDSGAKTAAATAAKAMLVWSTQNGSFAGATPAGLARIEPALAQAPGLTVVADETTFTVAVDSASAPGARFSVRRTEQGDLVRACTLPGKGSCLAESGDAVNQW
jgi:type IV pilus assembly protein PilA